MMKETIYGHALNPSLWIHAYGTTARLFQATYVACDCSPPQSSRNYCRFRSFRARDQGVRGCRVSTGDHSVLHAMVDLANLGQFVCECRVLVVQRPVAIVVVRASQHSLWGRLCLVTFSFLQKHRWHYQLYTGCRDSLHHTSTFSIDSDHKPCILAFGYCLVPPSNSIYVMTS